MGEKRKFSRVRRRLVLEFRLSGSHCYGFTHDLSPAGIFVRSIRIPTVGSPIEAELQLPDGKKLPIRGKVVRSYRAPSSLASSVPSGFGMTLAGGPEDYLRYLATL